MPQEVGDCLPSTAIQLRSPAGRSLAHSLSVPAGTARQPSQLVLTSLSLRPPPYPWEHPSPSWSAPCKHGRVSPEALEVLLLLQCQAEQLPREHRSAGREHRSAGRVHEEHQARLMGPRSRHRQPGEATRQRQLGGCCS